MVKSDDSGIRVSIKSKTATKIVAGVASLVFVGALTVLGFSVPGLEQPGTDHKFIAVEAAVEENEAAIETLEADSVDNKVNHAGLQQRLADIERSTRSVEAKVDELKKQNAEQHILLQVISRKLDSSNTLFNSIPEFEYL